MSQEIARRETRGLFTAGRWRFETGAWVVAIALLSSTGCDHGGQPEQRPISCVLVTRVRSDARKDECVFANITGLALDTLGHRIAVVDGGAQRVEVFASNGAYQFSIGRDGEVGYDWKQPCCAGFGNDGHLWLADRGTGRYVSFGLGPRSAHYASTIPMHGPLSGLVTRVAIDTLNRIVHWSDSMSADGKFWVVRALLESAGGVMNSYTLSNAPAESVAVKQLSQGGGPGLTEIAQPYGPSELRALSPNGETAEAISSRYAVSWFDEHRRLVRAVTGTYAPERVSQRERESAEQALSSVAKRAGLSTGELPFAVPAYKPPIRSIGFDSDDRLWVELSVADGQPHLADVYSRSGPRVGRFQWPANVHLDLWTVHGHDGIGVVFEHPGEQQVVALQFQN